MKLGGACPWVASLLCLATGVAQAAVPAISAGEHHTLSLSVDGTVRAWGNDRAGELGVARRLYSSVPLAVSGLTGVSKISAGSGFTLVVKGDGTVWGWGNDSDGRLGDLREGPQSVPAQVKGLSGVQAVAAGNYFSAALKLDGSVWTWGENQSGSLGDGSVDNRGAPAPVSGITDAMAVTVGTSHAVALRRDGTVVAWGSNAYGQVGDGTMTDRYTPVRVVGLTGVTAIASGGDSNFALKGDGTVWAWGRNTYGDLGDGTTLDRAVPVQLTTLLGVRTIAASFALMNDDTVRTWGYNVQSPVPVVANGLTDVIEISPGGAHVMFRKSDGSVWGYGYDVVGQLGDGTTTTYFSLPVPVVGLGTAIAISAGFGHTIALKADGSVWAWGDNSDGALGDGSVLERSTPAVVTGLSNVASIAAGNTHSVALKADGSVWTWGGNVEGELGIGGVGQFPVAVSTPVAVAGLGVVTSVAAGGYHTLALRDDRTVMAWGYTYQGQLGTGTSHDGTGFPVRTVGLSDVREISAGYLHSVARKGDGTVWAWGDNSSGQLGDGSTTDRLAPQQVSGLTRVIAISAGWSHTVALTDDGTVWAWGGNSSGQLGDGTYSDRSTPAPVRNLTGVVKISAGGSHTLATKADGSVWIWGDNGIDPAEGVDPRLPSQVPDFGGAAAISAGRAQYYGHSMVLKGEGTVWTWGNASNGQLGDGTLADRALPVVVLRENGTGNVDANNWYLDLDPAAAKTIPLDKIPKFLVITAGTQLNLTANIRFRTQDVGTTGSVFVFARVPAKALSSHQAAKHVTPKAGARFKDGATCVLAQLDPNTGQLVAASASGLQPYVSGVLSAQGQAVTVLNSANNSQLSGSTFFVGYGSDASQMASQGTNRSVLSVPGSGSCGADALQAAANVSYEGLWLKGDEAGWGVNLTHQGTTLFATWFTYDSDGSGMWLVASSVAQTSAGNYSGTLYRTVGPAFSASPFSSINFPANYTQVGTLAFAFTDANNGTMSYTVNGVTQSKAIGRYIYASGGTNCTLGGAQGASPNYQDLWLRSSSGTTEAGWGVNITHQGDILFATWFTYLPGSSQTNKGMWLVMSNGNKTAPGVYTGALQTTTGPAFSQVPFNPNNVARTTVGSGTFTFTDANNGTFSYTVNGITQSKPVARYVYASPTTVCQ